VVKETKIKSEDLCSVAMGCGVIKNPLIEWNITLPSIPKPPVTPTRLPKVCKESGIINLYRVLKN